VTVSPDGRYIASGGLDKKIRLWDSETGNLIKVFENRISGLPSLSFSPDSKRILSGTFSSGEKSVCYINEVPSGKVLHKFDHNGYIVKATAFSPDGRLAATGGGKNYPIVIFDSKTGKTIHKLIGKGRIVYSVGFGRDGNSIAWGNTLDYKNDCNRGPLEHWLGFGAKGQKGSIRYMGAVKNPNLFMKATLKNEKYSLKPGKNHKYLKLLKKDIVINVLQPKSRFVPKLKCYTFTPDSRYVISGGTAGELIMFETKTGKKVRHFYGHSGVIWSVAISSNGNRLVSGSDDQTVRVWDIETGENIFSFFHGSDNEWVAWIPEGFFDASPDGAKYIGYVINRGKDKAADYVGVDQLFDLYYRPDLVAMKLEGGHESEIFAELNKVKIDRILAGGVPPKVDFVFPETDETMKRRDMTLKIKLTDKGGGIGKIVYRINGVTIGTEDHGRAIKVAGMKGINEQSVIREKLITLQPGFNHITVTAYNQRNEIESRPSSIKLFLEDVISEKPSLYVLSIGINEYRDRALKLTYSVPDGSAFANEMKARGRDLYGKVRIETLFDREATLEGIEKMFNKLSKEVKTSDVFIFYIAGHGLNLDGKYHFIPWELIYQNEESVRKKSLTQERMQAMLAKIPALKSVVLLDTCNSGAFAKPASRGLAEKTAMEKLMRSTGRVTIAASSEFQVAFEGYEGHGVFTYALLQALSGSADKIGNNNGEISVNELAEYVSDEVPKITFKKWGYEQFPMQNLYGRSFPIVLSK